jgi:hypothetical protein
MWRYDIELVLASGGRTALSSIATAIDTDQAQLRVTRRRITEPAPGDDVHVIPADGTWETYPIEETDPE